MATNRDVFRNFEKTCMEGARYYAVRGNKIFEITGFSALDNGAQPCAMARTRVGTVPMKEQLNQWIDPSTVTDWQTLACVYKYPPLGVPEALQEAVRKIDEWYPQEMQARVAASVGKE